MNRRERLRAATREQHIALDGLLDRRGYFSSVAGYLAWLHCNYGFHRDAEAALERIAPETPLPLGSLRTRTQLLASDLEDISAHPCPKAATASLTVSDSVEAFGLLYVSEGASLGARVLLLRARALGFSETGGARHLFYSAHDLDHWHQFLERLEACFITADDEQRLVAAARQAFDAATAHFGGAP